ncbi:MAG TPA: hypothetical protein VM925_14975 [Labilithrix sp.]|nr:hypothetical protein [Labilithrix sp.]
MPSPRALLLTFALLTGACATSSTPRIRVARDLGCTADLTQITRLTENRWQVSGCGRTATYVCTYPVRDCWREGEIHSLDGAPPPPPPLASAP